MCSEVFSESTAVRNLLFILFASTVLAACSPQLTLHHTGFSNYRIKQDSLRLYDSSLYYTIQPYKSQLQLKMSEVVGKTETVLIKERPEGTLCNLMADASLETLAYNGFEAEVTVLNYGGVRIPSIETGNITLGKVYELMPFDNMLVVLHVEGRVLQQLLDLSAANGGWPVAGVRMNIDKGKATNVTINDKPLDENKVYKLATTDYMAGGGDKATMLSAAVKRIETGILLRDAIIHYIKKYSPLMLKKDGRVTHQP
jgi:2',3'-cyclic-nucleotide 2'-phosphodiesterase (5'-nucleotidase family)